MEDLLKLFGIVLLCCFGGAGIYIIVEYGSVERVMEGYHTYTKMVTNWSAMGTGIGLIIQGAFSFAISFVISNTFTKVNDITSKLNYLESKLVKEDKELNKDNIQQDNKNIEAENNIEIQKTN